MFFIWFSTPHMILSWFLRCGSCLVLLLAQRRRCCPNKLCRPSKCFPNRPLRLPNKLRNTKGSSTRSLFSFFYFKMFAFFKNYYLGVEQFNEFIMDSQNIEHALIVNHSFINVQVTHLAGVLGFGGFCFLLGARKLTSLADAFAVLWNVFQ